MLRRLAAVSLCVAASAATPTVSTDLRRAKAGSYPEYDRCKTREYGAGQWADGACVTGKSQSPIDVCGATGELDKKEVLSFAAGYGKSHTVKLTPSNNAYLDFSKTELLLSASNVPKIVGYADNAPTWKLVQAHFHWGRDKNDGSEHYLEGRQYPLEIHFVHMNTKYSALGDAAGNKDGLLVVGQMFQVGTSESASLTAMAAMMATGGDVSVTPTDMMRNEDGFYAYAGSLTTPGCNEAVTWINLAKPLDITQATLNKFLAIETDLLDHKLISKYGNYRNLQPRNGRTVYYSPGVQTAPCTVAAREPHFACDTEMGRTKLEIALAVLFAVTGALLIIVTTCFIRRKPETVYVNNPKDVEMPIKADMMFAPTFGAVQPGQISLAPAPVMLPAQTLRSSMPAMP